MTTMQGCEANLPCLVACWQTPILGLGSDELLALIQQHIEGFLQAIGWCFTF